MLSLLAGDIAPFLCFDSCLHALQIERLEVGAGGRNTVLPSAGNTKVVKKVCNMVSQLKMPHLGLLRLVFVSRLHESTIMPCRSAAEER